MSNFVGEVTRNADFITVKAKNQTLSLSVNNIIYLSLAADSTELIIICMNETVKFQFETHAGAEDVYNRMNSLLNATTIRAIDATVVNPNKKIVG